MAFPQHQAVVTSFDTFEETYQRSYSHGLEKIYALENVDIRSIRKIPSPLRSHSKKIAAKPSKKGIEQLTFPGFQKNLTSFIFREPIQVLYLNKRIERCLLEQDKFTIADLLEEDQQTPLPLKGMGQGHIDEIHDKLQNYLEEHVQSNHSPTIEFTSWMKTLLADLDAKKCAVLLEAFQLPILIPLSPSENAEIRKLTYEKRHQWIKEAISECCKISKKQQLNSDIQEITDLYLKPWLGKRAGMANATELYEYLIKLSGFYTYATQVLDFISHVYFQKKFPFASFLHPVEEELFCDNTETTADYYSIVETASTYFYKDDLYYSLESLSYWIGYEFAKKWQGFPENFIERILRLSNHFRVRKNTANQLIVKLS